MTAPFKRFRRSEPRGRAVPEVVRLPPRPDRSPSPKPAVRIFLGTEDAQFEAERVFFYSIERVRDPARAYEIHRMKDLAGFSRRGWRTGFTNYRFAIPDFAGREGKAIYNDVDQVYTADPAWLFDTDLGGHGYLAITPTDTSVMLIDCARMARWWNRETARRRHKHRLTRTPAAQQGLWGKLDPEWNARDMEYVEGRSRLLHFTTLHLQPWRPTPEQYSYRPHPLGEVWHRLKRAADAEGYQVFTADRPTADFRDALASWTEAGAHPATSWPQSLRDRMPGLSRHNCRRVGFGLGSREDGDDTVASVDLASGEWPEGPFRVLLAIGCLERVPLADRPWVLRRLFERSRDLLHLAVNEAEETPFGTSGGPTGIARWRDPVVAEARRRPGTAWQLDLRGSGPDGAVRLACASRDGDREAPPGVHLLLENRPEADGAARRLAETLADAWEEHPPNEGPPPDEAADLWVTAGPHGARGLANRSRAGTPLWVHLGRPAGFPLSAPDLVITGPQDRVPLRGNVLHLPKPLSPIDASTLSRAGQALEPHITGLARPWIGVLLGGGDLPNSLDPGAARELGRRAAEEARQRGGTPIIAPHSGIPEDLAAAVEAGASSAFRADRIPDEPLIGYRGTLALADAFIVTGDSAAALAAACARDRPVSVFDLEPRYDRSSRRALLWQRLLDRRTRTRSHRGTPRQQDWGGQLFDELQHRGRLSSPYDPVALREACFLSGLATSLRKADEEPVAPRPPEPEPLIRDHVHRLLSFRCT